MIKDYCDYLRLIKKCNSNFCYICTRLGDHVSEFPGGYVALGVGAVPPRVPQDDPHLLGPGHCRRAPQCPPPHLQ